MIMKYTLMLLLLAAVWESWRRRQDAGPPLSKGEVLDLLITSAPSKVIISTIQQYGIAFQPTPQVLEEFRKAGADKAVLAALREAWHEEIPRPLGDREILMMLAEDVPSENIVRTVQARGIDFQPTGDYLEGLRSQGAKDVLIDTLRTAVPRPFSKEELLQQLTARVDQEWIAQKIQQRAIDFEPGNANLQALRNAGARAPLLETVRTAKRVKPFVAHTPAGPSGVASPGGRQSQQPLSVSLPIRTFPCSPTLTIWARSLRACSAESRSPFWRGLSLLPGFDKIQYADGKEGFVANSYLEFPIATAGGGDHRAISDLQTRPQLYSRSAP